MESIRLTENEASYTSYEAAIPIRAVTVKLNQILIDNNDIVTSRLHKILQHSRLGALTIRFTLTPASWAMIYSLQKPSPNRPRNLRGLPSNFLEDCPHESVLQPWEPVQIIWFELVPELATV